jgi:signal transduction histidine kinase/ActR/RegA family two-component response regulator
MRHMNARWITPAAPSRGVSVAVTAALVLVWSLVRVVLFDTMAFPLTYIIPLLVCVWTRDRLMLWTMAGVFAALHVVKLYWMLPSGLLTDAEVLANLTATFINIGVGAAAVHAIVGLRLRLEGALTDIQAQADELQAQDEELTQQNEELAEQGEALSQQAAELGQQGEELATQNEELQSRSEEIGELVTTLEGRQRLLESLLDATRLSSTEEATLSQIAAAARELFGGDCALAAVFERVASGLCLRAWSSEEADDDVDAPVRGDDDFATFTIDQNRAAAIDNLAQRPDLQLLPRAQGLKTRAVLAAPIHFDSRAVGAFVLYCQEERDWTDRDFQLAEWLAEQCSRALQTLRAQARLRDEDRRKNEFLATLSHELRNPLAPIRFALSLIQDKAVPSDKPLQVVERQFQHLVRLVDDLLDATRLSSSKLPLRKTRIDVVGVVQQAVDASAHAIEAAEQTLMVTLPPEPVWMYADPDRLGQVVLNLLNNASRYTAAGGQLSVRLSAGEDEMSLVITDTGQGLRHEDTRRIFDMFTQVGEAGSGGLGLGLAIVRGIVELHGGRVDARSSGAGQGSEFHVRLPLTAPAALEEIDTPPAVAVASSPLRVLIVDDNVDSAEMMAALLETQGHEVSVAHDGYRALQVAAELPPDVALLDIGLPGMDGYVLAQRLRQDALTRDLRLIAVTGWGQDGDRARAHQAGFDGHLTKPADPSAILAMLQRESAG